MAPKPTVTILLCHWFDNEVLSLGQKKRCGSSSSKFSNREEFGKHGRFYDQKAFGMPSPRHTPVLTNASEDDEIP